jgi:hypothetical protein
VSPVTIVAEPRGGRMTEMLVEVKLNDGGKRRFCDLIVPASPLDSPLIAVGSARRIRSDFRVNSKRG